MKQDLKHWLPIALCCLPGIALAIVIAVGLSAGGAAIAGWLGWGVRALAIVACPVAMGSMMWWMGRNMDGQTGKHQPQSAADQLAALRVQEQVLEAQVAAAGRTEVTRANARRHRREAL